MSELGSIRLLLDEAPGVEDRTVNLVLHTLQSVESEHSVGIQDLTDPSKYDGRNSVIEHILMSCEIAAMLSPSPRPRREGHDDSKVRWPKYFGFSLPDAVLLSDFGKFLPGGNNHTNDHGSVSCKWLNLPSILSRSVQLHAELEQAKFHKLALVQESPEGYYGAAVLCLCQVLAGKVLCSPIYESINPLPAVDRLLHFLKFDVCYHTAEPMKAIIRKTGIPEEIWHLPEPLHGQAATPVNI